MTDTTITREAVEQLMYILRFRANSINMNYLQHPIADDLRAAADRLIALRDELDRVTDRLAEFEAAWTASEGATVSADLAARRAQKEGE